MAPSKVVRRRGGGIKVRTGCKTCKIRRVKCDEVKPFCKRCSSTGRKCDGYESDKPPTPQNGTGLETLQKLAVLIPGNTREKRGFHYFIKNAAAELSGYYDNGFWEYLLLQVSQSESSLRHAVVALGTLHEDFINKKPLYSPENSGFAINQYTKAIGHLRKSLATGKQATLTALMSCILFVCFDSIRGLFSAAMVHLQSGLRILRSLKGASTEEDKIIKNVISPMFVRLACQCILYVDTREKNERFAWAMELMKTNLPEEPVPEQFENLEEARNTLNQAADGLFRMFYMSDGDLPSCCQPTEAFKLHETYSTQLTAWSTTFERLMNTKSANFTNKQIRGAALLKIQHIVISIMANIHTPDINSLRPVSEAADNPASFQHYHADFLNIVNLSRSLITASEQDTKNGKPSLTFSTDLGLIAPLYYVCTHCYDADLRLQAAALLSRCPRREGMWDGEATAKIVREYWAFKDAAGEPVVFQQSEIPKREVVGLEMSDGMVLAWKWRNPVVRGAESMYGSSSGISDVVSTAGWDMSIEDLDDGFSLSSESWEKWLLDSA